MSLFKKVFGSKQKNPMMETIIGFIEAKDKDDYLQQHPELLTPAAIQHLDLMLEAAIAAGNEADADVLRAAREDLVSLAIDQFNGHLTQSWQTGQYEQGLRVARQAYDFAEKILGQEHPYYVPSLYNLAGLYKATGDYAQAEPLYRQAIEISRTTLDEDHPDLAVYLNGLAGLYKSQGEYAQAEPLYRQALEIERTVLGEQAPDFATSLNNLAELYRTMGNYAQAETLCRQALEIRRAVLGEQDPDFANSLNTLALVCDAQGDYAQAETLYQQVLTILRVTKGESHPYYAITLNSLTELYKTTGAYAQAESLYRQAIEIKRTTLGENHRDFAVSLNNLADLYQTTGDYAQARPLFEQIVEIYRTTLDENHPDFATSLNNLASFYRTTGDYAQAEPLFLQALEIRRTIRGEQHPDFAAILNNLADLYLTTGNYAQARPLFQQAVEITRATLGDQHPDFAICLGNLGKLYLRTGDYALAEPLFQQALEIGRTVFGENHPDATDSLSWLAGVYHKMGAYTQAEALYQQIIEIERTALGEADPGFAVSLGNLAQLYRDMGHYAQAKPLSQQAIEIIRVTRGEQHRDFATCLNNLALLYLDIGDYAQAESLFHQSLEISRTVLGEDHTDFFAACLDNLAKLYQAMGDYTEAEPLYRQALEIRHAVLGEQHYDSTETLHNLASLYDATGDYAQAERLYRQVIEIRRTSVGERHPGFAVSLNNLALLYKIRGDFAQAEPLYRQAMEIRRTGVGERHPDYAQSLSNLASLCAATDRPEEALQLLTQAVAIDDQLIGQIFSIGSESQRKDYLNQVSGYTSFFFSLILQDQADQVEAIRRGLDFLLRRKALGAEGLAVQRDAVLSGHYPELAAQFHQLSQLRQQIALKTLAGPGPEGLPAHQQQLADWYSQQKTLEANLVGQIPEMNLAQKLQATNLHTVAQALPEASLLVEFIRFDVFDFKAIPAQGDSPRQPARYLAFVLPAGKSDHVPMIDLGPAEAIDQLITAYRATITGETDQRGLFYDTDEDSTEQPSASESGRQLRAAIFDPLLLALDDCHRLFLSPDGDLSRLPFEILPTDEGRRLIDEYQLSYVNTGRDILRFGAKYAGEPTAPVVVADPDFDLAAEGEKPDKQAAGKVKAVTEQEAAVEGRQSRDLNRAGLHFGRLPGTRSEGEKIAEMLSAVTLFGPEAVEARFKQIRSPRILHIATHGFFLPDQQSAVSPESLSAGISAHSLGRLGVNLENPLLRSGLALAGANTWLRNGLLPAEAEDALFNGEDVTALDLLATELVVLSACETGLGEVQVGEGVFGLRRAFVLAGAKTLVMSLWKVPDQQTQELMTDFYRRILAGEPRAEALRQAQLTLKEKYPNPLYWGAFICQGDPGPLEGMK